MLPAAFSCSPHLWPFRLIAGALLAVSVYSAASVARADEYTDVNRLTSKGEWALALSKADAHLAAKPRDPQMRFLRGVILSETGRANQAEEVFTLLTQEYPELPEPYNNLAVLLAARQQLDQARAALEMALRNDPAYATAHENLGDVLVQLAARSYAKALQIDPSRQRLQPKLGLARQMSSITDKP
jgi:Flp pilus assembly protein TadD